jgi:hypothetical protein
VPCRWALAKSSTENTVVFISRSGHGAEIAQYISRDIDSNLDPWLPGRIYCVNPHLRVRSRGYGGGVSAVADPDLENWDPPQDIEWGNAIHNPESYTHCLLVTFQTDADMQVYEEHPAHIAIVEKYGHLVQDLAALDCWSKE